MKLLTVPDEVPARRHAFFIDDDFATYVDAALWTKLAADIAATVAAADAVNGVVELTTGPTDNNEAAISTTKKVFDFADDKPHELEASVQYAEAATDDANVFVGFISAAAANTMQDNGAGPAADFDGCGIFKVDGGTNWKVVVSDGTTQTIVELTKANSLDGSAKTAGGSAQQRLAIRVAPKSATKADVTFFIDDALVWKETDWAFGTDAMFARAYVKAGGATSEVLKVDRFYAGKKR